MLGSQIGDSGIIWTLAFLLAVALACWLIGFAGQSRLRRPQWILVLLGAFMLAALAFLAFPERYLRNIHGEGGDVQSPAVRTSAEKIPWEPFSVARVEQLVKQQRTVFVDFTAAWCITCQINEKRTLETDKVRQLFEKYHVTPLKADWTARDQTIGRVLAQFGSKRCSALCDFSRRPS